MKQHELLKTLKGVLVGKVPASPSFNAIEKPDTIANEYKDKRSFLTKNQCQRLLGPFCLSVDFQSAKAPTMSANLTLYIDFG